MKRPIMPVLASCAVLLLLVMAAAAQPTPEDRCRANKTKAAGKYAFCLQNAAVKLVASGNGPRYSEMVLKCTYKFAASWQRAEAKAAAQGNTCPDEPLEQAAVAGLIDDCSTSVSTALGGGGLPDCPADLASCQTNLDTCTNVSAVCQGALDLCTTEKATCAADLANCQGRLLACEAAPYSVPLRTGQTNCWNNDGTPIPCTGTGQDGDVQIGALRGYSDNGDGTVSDNRTALMWEKLSDDGTIHDKDTTYTPWVSTFAKITQLNTAPCFANHCDWRLPNVTELQTIVNYGVWTPAVDSVFNTACTLGCSTASCSCTGGRYWSSTAVSFLPTHAWTVNFGDASMGGALKTDNPGYGVRAVRNGS